MNTFKQIFLLLALFVINSYGQNNNGVTIPDIIPKSPEVKGFERYGEYPVSEYTGIPSINIPLHIIQLRDIEFPISLDYHATGIQVTQEATWAGLGWNLMAGGCISTIQVGAFDYSSYYVKQPTDWEKMLNYNASASNFPRRFREVGPRLFNCDGVIDPNDPYSNEQTPTTDDMLMEAMFGSGERDIYNISFMGNSFKVSIHPITNQIIYHGEKNKFKVQKNGLTSWLITDEFGYIYLFSAIESYQLSSASQQSTYYLTKIMHPNQSEPLLEIHYQEKYVTYLPNISENITYKKQASSNTGAYYPCDRGFSYYSGYKQLYLSSIISPLDSIVFTTATRTDLRNALALDEMKVYERSTKSEIKRYKFEHDYFTGIATGAGATTEDYVTKRLKLTGLKEMKGVQTKDSYQFAYNEISLPYKTSFSQDFWGYYNGMSNSTSETIISSTGGDAALYPVTKTLLPNPFLLSLNQPVAKSLENVKGVNRAANPDLVTAGMLKSITYPTGGKTEFEFESHIFNNRIYPDANTVKNAIQDAGKHVFNNGNSTYSTPSIVFENEIEVPAKIKGTICGQNYTADQMGVFYVTLKLANQTPIQYAIDTQDEKQKFNNNNKTFVFEEDIILPVGRIEISTSIPPNVPNQSFSTLTNGVQADLFYQEVDYNRLREGESVGGGVRIKSIKNYTDNNVIASIKSHNYVSKNRKSSGKLIHPMQFINSLGKILKWQGTTGSNPLIVSDSLRVDILSSNNIYNYSTSECESTIGYDRVEIKNNSLTGGNHTGKRIVEFYNTSDNIQYNDIPFFYPSYRTGTIYNGKLSTQTILDRNKDTLSVNQYKYEYDNFTYNHINVNVTDIYEGPLGCEFMSGMNGRRFHIVVYPTLSYTVHLTQQDETTYVESQKIEKTTLYEYDPSVYKPNKITEVTGNKNRITKYMYGIDHPYLEAKNMVGIPIAESVSMGTNPVQRKEWNYILSNNAMVLSTVSVQNAANASEERLKYANYDSFGNPRYLTKDDVTKVVYLWGYNYQYPIAKIENATYDQIKNIVSEATMDDIAKKMAPTTTDMDQINNLRTNSNLKEAFVTSYWYSPLVGISQVRDPSGQDIFFEYDTFNRLKDTYIMENGSKKIVKGYDYYIKQ